MGGFAKILFPILACVYSLNLYLNSLPCHAAIFDITNRCTYTVWAAANRPGGGRRLDSGQSWQLNLPPVTRARIWGRTGCNFEGGGRGQCSTGDCNDQLECQAGSNGQPPNSLILVGLSQQPNNLDYYGISLVEGFNIPLQISPTNSGCRSVSCAGPINEQCPNELRVPGGCNSPCLALGGDQYCCSAPPCPTSAFSRFFQDRCPDASVSADRGGTFTCSPGTNYRVVFCP